MDDAGTAVRQMRGMRGRGTERHYLLELQRDASNDSVVDEECVK